jgi:hypothetical protein
VEGDLEARWIGLVYDSCGFHCSLLLFGSGKPALTREAAVRLTAALCLGEPGLRVARVRLVAVHGGWLELLDVLACGLGRDWRGAREAVVVLLALVQLGQPVWIVGRLDLGASRLR